MLFIEYLQKKLLQIEVIILVSAFFITLSVAFLQIVLRNFFDSGIIWGDNFLRISVLWLGMLGAIFASRKNHHININLGQKFSSGTYLNFIQMIIHLFTAIVCYIIAWYGLNLVLIEHEDGMTAFANVPVWITVSIIPLGFSIMALRYFILALLTFFNPQSHKQTDS